VFLRFLNCPLTQLEKTKSGRLWRLEEVGSVDDLRVFIHIHEAQEILGKGRVVNAIELIGCGCKQDLVFLGAQIENLLPGAKTQTITQIVRTQAETVSLMERFALIVLLVILVVGWGLISNTMASDVIARHREVGILMALGATRRFIFLVFIKKAVTLGALGGFLGFIIGSITATWIGPKLLDLSIEPRVEMLAWSLMGTIAFTVVSSWIPSLHATRSDPAILLMEN
jgi:putative ABC transport system permease protein